MTSSTRSRSSARLPPSSSTDRSSRSTAAGPAPNICPTSVASPSGWPVAELDPREAQPVLFTVEDGIATITLNRPHEGNAITPGMQEALEKAWHRVQNDHGIRVAI